ncbi:MAG: tautomerase family protein [Burkholderiaceae bacterium]
MPVLHLNLIRGYDEQTRELLAKRLTDAVRATIAADPAAVTVFLHEVDPAGYMRAGRSARPGPAIANAQTVVLGYLAEMEARDLSAAASRLADGFVMEFPGPVSFRRPAELVDWAASRYRRIGKIVERSECVFADGATVVWCYGTLFGEWPDGSPFEGIRFVDRFTVVDGLIHDQKVWNDLAEVRAGTG